MYSPPFHWNNTQGLFDSQIGMIQRSLLSTQLQCAVQARPEGAQQMGRPGDHWVMQIGESCIWVVNFSDGYLQFTGFFHPNLWIIQTKRQALLAFFCTSSHFKLAPRKKTGLTTVPQLRFPGVPDKTTEAIPQMPNHAPAWDRNVAQGITSNILFGKPGKSHWITV